MNKKRYAIVRVDINCPKDVCGEEDFCFLSKGKTLEDMCDHCEFLQEKRIIGDTKKQLIRKVAQVIFKAKLERYRKVWKCECSEMEKRNRYKDSLILAEKVVEFLGVE